LEYRFLDNFGNVSEYSSPVIVPIISSDSRDAISITSLAGYSGESYVTNVAPDAKSPRVGVSALGMLPAGSYPASNISRGAAGADSLIYTWSPVASGSNYSYDVYLSWKTGLNPPILATSASLRNYNSVAHTATLEISPEFGSVSDFIVGQYITATNPSPTTFPATTFGDPCYVTAINTSENSIDIKFTNGNEYNNYSDFIFTNIKSATQTWLPFQFAGTTKSNSFSFQIKDIQTGVATVSDVQFVQALVSISTYPKYQNDYINRQTVWSISPAFSTWQTATASLGISSNGNTSGAGIRYFSTLTINGTVNPIPTISQAKDLIGKQIVVSGYSGTVKVHGLGATGFEYTRPIVETSSNIASSTSVTNLSF
jgi:hypothetical protein